jgi:hypothetical protein
METKKRSWSSHRPQCHGWVNCGRASQAPPVVLVALLTVTALLQIATHWLKSLRRLLLVAAQNRRLFDTSDLRELPFDHHVRELVAIAEVGVAGLFASELAAQVLAEHVGSRDRRLVALGVSVHGGDQHDERVLNALAHVHDTRLAVAELHLVLDHVGRDFQGELGGLLEREVDVLLKPAVHAGNGLTTEEALEVRADVPERERNAVLHQLPGAGEDLTLGEGLHAVTQRQHVVLAVLGGQREEELHGEHFAFAFVDERGEVIVDVVTHEVAVQEGATAVRRHGDVDGGFLLSGGTEDLRDDALELTAVAFVELAGAPLAQRIGADDETSQAGDPLLHQLTRLDRLREGDAVLAPALRADAAQQEAHDTGGVGAERDTTVVQAVISDDQAVAIRRGQAVGSGHAEVDELEAVVVGMTQSVDAVVNDLEVLVLGLGQLDDEDRRLLFALDARHKTDGAARDRVRDEELLAVDDVLVAFQARDRLQSGEVGASARLGESEGRDALTGGQARQEASLLLVGAEDAYRVDRADAAVDGGHARFRREAGRRHFGDHAGEAVQGRALAAVLLVDEHAPVTGSAEVRDGLLADLAVLVVGSAGSLVGLQRRDRAGNGLFDLRIDLALPGQEVPDTSLGPDDAVHGASRGAAALAVEFVGGAVGAIDRTGALDLVLALARIAQDVLGEVAVVLDQSVVVLLGHRFTLPFRYWDWHVKASPGTEFEYHLG